MKSDQSILTGKSRFPIWLRLPISIIFSMLTALGLWGVAYLIRSGNPINSGHMILILICSTILIWINGFLIRRLGDRLGFGAKRIICASLAGGLLILVCAFTIFFHVVFSFG